jgi:hypothetical protein
MIQKSLNWSLIPSDLSKTPKLCKAESGPTIHPKNSAHFRAVAHLCHHVGSRLGPALGLKMSGSRGWVKEYGVSFLNALMERSRQSKVRIPKSGSSWVSKTSRNNLAYSFPHSPHISESCGLNCLADSRDSLWRWSRIATRRTLSHM